MLPTNVNNTQVMHQSLASQNEKIMKNFAALLLFFCFFTSAQAMQSLPQLSNIDHIEISGPSLDIIVITDTQKIIQIVNFINPYQSTWSLAAKNKIPDNQLTFSFYSNNEHISDIGFSALFISQLYGKQWSQAIPKNIMKQFAGSIHPVIEENLFPIIPVDADSDERLNFWQHKISQLKSGMNHQQLKSFIRDNKIRIKQVNRPVDGKKYWINLQLSLVNDGSYVDTIIAAQIFLNQDHSLQATHFLGYQLAKKSAITKHITSNVHASNY